MIAGCQLDDNEFTREIFKKEQIEVSNTPLDIQEIAPEKLNINEILKENKVSFKNTEGSYPLLLDNSHQEVNQEIQKMIDDLKAYDDEWSDKTGFGGVHILGYNVWRFDNDNLGFGMDMSIGDETMRYYTKYYQIDLKNKKRVLLGDYFKEKSVNVDELNKVINQQVAYCDSKKNTEEKCQDLTIGDLENLFEISNGNIDIVEHSHSFYINDDEYITVAFLGNERTTIFKVNIYTYEIDF